MNKHKLHSSKTTRFHKLKLKIKVHLALQPYSPPDAQIIHHKQSWYFINLLIILQTNLPNTRLLHAPQSQLDGLILISQTVNTEKKALTFGQQCKFIMVTFGISLCYSVCILYTSWKVKFKKNGTLYFYLLHLKTIIFEKKQILGIVVIYFTLKNHKK